MKLEYNYHTHTERCGHAYGSEEEYIQEAIKFGIKRLGFSDHIILPKGHDQPGIRGSYTLYNDYIETLKSLREKYKDQIEIKIGFEAEYIPSLVEHYKKILKTDIDYLILGQHCYFDNEWHFYPYSNESIKGVQMYVDDVLAGLKTGLFKYLVHPDLFMVAHDVWNKDLEKEARRLLKGCEEMNIPIEVNILGMRRKEYNGRTRSYPNDYFFELAKEYNLKIVLGVDAHDPTHFCQIALDKANYFIKKHNLIIDYDFKI